MSSTPGGVSFKDHLPSSIPPLLASFVGSSAADTLPLEEEITQLRKEVDDYYSATRKQANRYQRDLETLSSRHGTADQARRREMQKNSAAQIAAAAASKPEEGITPRCPANAHRTHLTLAVVVESGSESDVPLRKKRKLDDASVASTPRLSTPKGMQSPRLLSWGNPDWGHGPMKVWRFANSNSAQKKQASKRPSPAPPIPLQVIPRPAHPIYEPIDLAHLPPPPRPILDRTYLAAENLDFEHTSPEDIERLLGVSQYPTTDLSKDLPGIPPTDDFSKVKVQNQTSYDTWLKSIEPYFRPFSEDDLTFLRQQGDNIAPYIIPPLGPDYLEVWHSDPDLPFHGSPAPGPHPDIDSCMPRGSAENLRDENLESMELVSAGPLAERVLSALVEEKINLEDKDQADKDGEPSSTDATGGGQSWRVAVSKADYVSFEERLKGELKYIGLLTVPEDNTLGGLTSSDGENGIGGATGINWNNREDDEICQELRKLQKQLRQQSLENAARKMILEKKVEEQLAYQEYANILEDLDRQVGDAFNKRTKSIKAKKRRWIGGAGGGSSSSGAPGSVAGKTLGEKTGIGDGAKPIIDRRRRWIEKVGPVFRPTEKFIRVPTTAEGGSIYEDLAEYIKKAEEEAKLEELRLVEETN